VDATFADSAAPVAGEYDLVVANILSNPLRVLAPAICAHVRTGGRLALSGILREQAEEITAIYAHWLPLEVADVREDWVCLAGTKP
jgi:ribosomal protein L11 methyltransferase